MKKLNLSDVEGRFAVIPREALQPIQGQHPTLTALALAAADVPALVARIRELEGRVRFARDELSAAVPDDSSEPTAIESQVASTGEPEL